MNRLEVAQRGTIIDVKFPEERVSIRAERLRDKGDSFKAELVIEADLAMGDSYRKQRLNRGVTDMLSDGAKKALVTTLSEITEDYPNILWGNIIRDSFDAIMDTYREGVPVETMNGLDVFTPRTYALYPMFVKGVANLMWAPGGSGKSYFALLTCVMVDRGMNTMNMRAPKGNVLYLDWEEEPDVFRQRLFALQKGLDVSNPEESGILYKKMVGSLASNIESISKTVIDNNITYLVVDSVGPALGGSGIDQEVVEEYFRALRVLDVTNLSIDHANRAGETTGQWQIHGSAFKYARARQVYEVRKVQEHESGELEVVLYHRKANDSGSRSPRGFRINFEMRETYNEMDDEYERHLESVKFEMLGLGDADSEFLRRMNLTQICFELIKAHGETNIDILRSNVSIIKDSEVSDDVIKRTIENSKTMKLENSVVMLRQEETEWNIKS